MCVCVCVCVCVWVCVCEIGLHCPISDRGEISTRDSNIRVRNALEAHKTLFDLKKIGEKKFRKSDLKNKSGKILLRCPISKNLKIGFLEYLQIFCEVRYPNGPIGYWKKYTIWKEACIVHVGIVIQLITDNVNFCTWSRLYQRESSRSTGPGWFFLKENVCFPPLSPLPTCTTSLKQHSWVQGPLQQCFCARTSIQTPITAHHS